MITYRNHLRIGWTREYVLQEICKKVQDGEAITCCAPLVIQPKPKFTEMKSEELALHIIKTSIDMRI